MKAILLAAGEGKRMRPLTLERPKAMLEVLGKPLIHWIIESLPDEITEVILVIGYKGDDIKKYIGDRFEGRKITYVWQKLPEGTAAALALCKPYLDKDERFLFMYADDLHSAEAMERLLKKPLGALVKEHSDPTRFGVFEVDEKDRLIGLEEKPKIPKSNLVAVGVYVLNTHVFDYQASQHEKGEYFLTDQIAQMIKDHELVAEKTDFWHPIGYPEDIAGAEKVLREQNK